MILEEMLMDERTAGRLEGRVEGKAEAVIELLEALGELPDGLESRISGETDSEILGKWLRLAAKSDTMEAFLKSM